MTEGASEKAAALAIVWRFWARAALRCSESCLFQLVCWAVVSGAGSGAGDWPSCKAGAGPGVPVTEEGTCAAGGAGVVGVTSAGLNGGLPPVAGIG